MQENKILELNPPQENEQDLLSKTIGKGAQRILKEAQEIEIESFLNAYRDLRTVKEKRLLVQNGYFASTRNRHKCEQVDGGNSEGKQS